VMRSVPFSALKSEASRAVSVETSADRSLTHCVKGSDKLSEGQVKMSFAVRMRQHALLLKVCALGAAALVSVCRQRRIYRRRRFFWKSVYHHTNSRRNNQQFFSHDRSGCLRFWSYFGNRLGEDSRSYRQQRFVCHALCPKRRRRGGRKLPDNGYDLLNWWSSVRAWS
jgi:hypothetical protein